MVLPHMRLRALPELVVVLALYDVAADARDLLHTLIVRWKDPVRLARRLGKIDEGFAK
jgi:hypothetical protein